MKIFRCLSCWNECHSIHAKSCILVVDESCFDGFDGYDCIRSKCPYDLADEPEWREASC